MLSVEGNAEISADGARTFSPLGPSQTAGKGAVVRTGPDGRISLAILPNCLIRLEPDTSVEIRRIALLKDGYETGSDIRGRFAEVTLVRGRIFVSHLWGETRARLAVALGKGEVSTPSNAAFWAEFVEERTRITCVSGWIEFRPSASPTSTRIRPGWIGQWPFVGENLSPADADPRGQEDIQRAMELEQQMSALLNKRRDLLPR